MNEENGHDLVQELGSSGKFFVCDVLDTGSVSKAVQGTADWANQTGKPLGGVIPAAGVSTPGTVRFEGPLQPLYGVPQMVWLIKPISLLHADS
jgi:hypothetical protein